MGTFDWTLHEFVARLGGEVIGNGEVRIERVASLEQAEQGCIGFLSNPRLSSQLEACRASALIVGERFRPLLQSRPGNYIVVPNPHVYFARVAQLLHPYAQPTPGVHPSAVVNCVLDPSVSVGPGVWIDEQVHIGPGSVISAGCTLARGTHIGASSYLHARVTVYADCHIGERAVIHSGAVIGADGFGFAREADGAWVKVPQVGRVLIGDDVEIGANTTIDRGALDDTVIADGVIIDNLVQIAHNVRIGRHSAIAGCVGIAGSTHIGERCMLGGAAMIIGHLHICDDVVVSAGTLISKSITTPGPYSGGLPQQAHGEWLKNFSKIRHLDEMADRIRKLEKQLAELGAQSEK